MKLSQSRHYIVDDDGTVVPAADDHDSARQSEKERADYAESELSKQETELVGLRAKLAEAQEETARIKAFLGDASPKSEQAYARMQAELAAAREKLNEREESYAALQVRCFEGFPSATDGIFDAYAAAREREREYLDMIGAAHERERVLRAALDAISRGEGRYSRDPLTHASNTIEDMKTVAVAALRSSEEKP